MDNLRLIELVQQREQLWDVRNIHYHNRDFSRKLWNEIAEDLERSSHLVKSRWQSLRDTYRKEYMKLIREGDQGRGATWKYFNNLSFLNEVIALRKTPSVIKVRKSIKRLSKEHANKTKVTSSNNMTDLNNTEETEYIEDAEEYTDINPLRYLCVVPQVTCDEADETVSSVQETVSDDHTGPADGSNAKSTSITSGSTIPSGTGAILKSRGSVPKQKRILSNNELMDEIDDDNIYNNQYRYAFNSSPNPQFYINNQHDSLTINDADHHFLISLLPYLKDVPKHRKLLVRQKLQQIFLDEQELTNSTITQPTETSQTITASRSPNVNSEKMEYDDNSNNNNNNSVDSDNTSEEHDDTIIVKYKT